MGHLAQSSQSIELEIFFQCYLLKRRRISVVIDQDTKNRQNA